MFCFDFSIEETNTSNVPLEFLTFAANYTDNEYFRAI